MNNWATRPNKLYPAVDETDTPLPRKWNPLDKHQLITLHDEDLLISSTEGNIRKDPGSFRSTHPIPAACGVFYFEIKVITKGRYGNIGLGVTAEKTSLKRLPAGHKFSYSINGHSSAGKGLTFIAGDVIGCGINLVNNSCFYTKNGINLEKDFFFKNLDDQPVYPTVGLETPNGNLLANFGQQDFMFNFEDYLNERRSKTVGNVVKRASANKEIPGSVDNLVKSYLAHHGYVSTLEAVHKQEGTNKGCRESLESIKKRQKIKKLVLSGNISDAIAAVEHLFPGLLDADFNLKFMLQVRQFIEMINGVDHLHEKDKKVENSLKVVNEMVVDHSEPMSTDEYLSEKPVKNLNKRKFEKSGDSVGSSNGNCNKKRKTTGGREVQNLADMIKFGQELHLSLKKHNEQQQQDNDDNTSSEEMYPRNQSILKEAYSLLAYNDPASSSFGYLLEAVQREPVFEQLNSAMMKAEGLPFMPPLKTLIGQTKLCLKTMLRSNLAEAAFLAVSDCYVESKNQ